MDAATERTLLEEFMERAAAKRREKRMVELNDQLFEERKVEEKQDKERAEKFYEATTQATHEQLAVFSERLEQYDTATVRALMDNERALDEVRMEREALDARAFKFDGRAVFKSQDGKHVFDANDAEIANTTLDPNLVPDGFPTREENKAVVDKENKLLQERQQIHDFQNRVDEARTEAGKDGVTVKKLDDLGADLDQAMPDAVRREMAGATPALATPEPVAFPGQRPASRQSGPLAPVAH